MNGEPAIHCLECKEEIEIGELVIPVARFDGTAEVSGVLSIHLKCLATKQEARQAGEIAASGALWSADLARRGL